jgi:uncharacterized protein YndB with AHSA1/START domain
MNHIASLDAHGVLTDPATFTIERLLPGPVELVWAALTESNLRKHWLAAGEMVLEPGAPFEFVWRNDELSDPSGQRPEGFEAEYRLQSRITAIDAPRRLSITWDETGDVTFEVEPQGRRVLLRVIHQGLTDRDTLLAIAAGWHMHLDILVTRAKGREPEPFWAGWQRLREDYDRRFAN